MLSCQPSSWRRALPAAAQAPLTPERPFGTLREQAALQQEWLKKRLDTFLPGSDAQARHRPLGRADARVQRGPGVPRDHVAARRSPRAGARSTSSSTSAPRRRAPPSAACVERIALGGSSQGGVFEARRSTKAAAGDVGRGRQAELWGDEQWQALKAVIEERNPKAIGIDRSTVFAFSDGLSSGELQGMTAGARRQVDRPLQERRGPSARAHRVAPARGGGLLQAHAGARLVAVAGDVLGQGHHARQDADERPRLVVAAARQRPRPRHVVPAVGRRPAARQDRRPSSARIRSSSAATCCTATSASPWRASTPTPSTWPTCCCRARRTRPRACAARSRAANALQDIVLGRAAAGPHGQRDPGGLARAHAGRRRSTARSTRTRSA